MYLDAYFETLQERLDFVREEQRANIEAAGVLVAQSLAEKGIWAVMDTGHLLQHEAHIRAGGLIALTPFAYELKIDDDNATRPEKNDAELELQKARLALDASRLCTGDVLLINSNSGRTANVIEVALHCKKRGIKTIGLASTAQMNACQAAHPSGKKLHEVVDVAIDNGAPFGDAAVPVKDNEAMCPLSGILSASILWAIQADAVTRLEKLSIAPSIYRSVHVSGQEFVDEQRRLYQERGI
jgi:uncharacterized phosphosugar-binding protein